MLHPPLCCLARHPTACSCDAYAWLTAWIMQHQRVRKKQKHVEIVIGEYAKKQGQQQQNWWMGRDTVENAAAEIQDRVDFRPAEQSSMELPFTTKAGRTHVLRFHMTKSKVRSHSLPPRAGVRGAGSRLCLTGAVCVQCTALCAFHRTGLARTSGW